MPLTDALKNWRVSPKLAERIEREFAILTIPVQSSEEDALAASAATGVTHISERERRCLIRNFAATAII